MDFCRPFSCVNVPRRAGTSICKSVKPYLGVRRSCRLRSSCGSTNSDNARGAENDVTGTLGRLKPMSDIGCSSFGSCN